MDISKILKEISDLYRKCKNTDILIGKITELRQKLDNTKDDIKERDRVLNEINLQCVGVV